MSTNKHIDKICIAAVCLTLVITILFMFGEKLGITAVRSGEDESAGAMFTADDLNAEWDTAGACEIVLNGDSAKISGSGAYFSNNTLYITCAGKYAVSGTLDGSIRIDANGNDKIWLLFDGVNIISKNEPPLYIKQADKVFLTLKGQSQNTLAFENEDEEAKIDGCIFSRDDLTVNGEGNLTVTSSRLHGIVCNDSLVFTGGNINITAKADGVHAHDAIRICNTAITVSAGDDGLHAGNDDETAVFYLESGNISIDECYEGIEANDIAIAGGTVYITPSDDGINANGSGYTSELTVSGGDITVINKSGRDADGLDSNGNISITGGNVFISVSGSGTNNAVDYGSEIGGKFTISGGTVVACGSSQLAESPDGNSAQGFIMETVSGNENEAIKVLDADGKEIISKEIPCSFTSVIISSPGIAVGDAVTLKIGDTETEITVDNAGNGAMGSFGNTGGFGPDDKNQPGGFPSYDVQNPPENENGGDPPELPSAPGEGEAFSQGPNPGNDPPQTPDVSESEENGNASFEPPVNNDQKQNGDFYDDDRAQNGQGPMPDNKANNANDSKGLPNGQSGLTAPTWITIGISVLILISGIFAAVKKKY